MPPCPLHRWAFGPSTRLRSLDVLRCSTCGWLPIEALGAPEAVVEFLLGPANVRFSKARKGTNSNLLSWLRMGPSREVEGVGWALVQGCLPDSSPFSWPMDGQVLVHVNQVGNLLRLHVVGMPPLPHHELRRLLGLLDVLSGSCPEEGGWRWDPDLLEVVGERRRLRRQESLEPVDEQVSTTPGR